MNRWASWAIRITHIPTGTTVETDEMGWPSRSMFKARQALFLQLRSKVAAGQPPTALVRTYDLIENPVETQRLLDGDLTRSIRDRLTR